MCLQCSKRSPVLETHRTSAKRSPFLDVHHTTITVIAAVDTLFYSCAVVSGLLNATKRASSSNCDTHSAIWALVGALDFELLIAHWVYRPCSTSLVMRSPERHMTAAAVCLYWFVKGSVLNKHLLWMCQRARDFAQRHEPRTSQYLAVADRRESNYGKLSFRKILWQ